MRIFGFLFISLLLNTSVLFAQEGQDDLSHYFDDDDISQAKNILKFCPTCIIAGDIPVFFERVIAPVLTVEAGAGLLLDMNSFELFGRGDDNFLSNPGPGYSIWVNPKIYYSGEAPEYHSIGFLFRRREYYSGLTFNDFVINSSIQFFLVKRMIFEISGGVGLRHIQVSPFSTFSRSASIDIVMPYSLEIGFVL